MLVRLAPVVGPRHVEVDIAGDLPPIAGDAAFVDQCLANLVENVARHTPETATAWIRAHELDDDGPPGVEIEVEDDGPGVDAEAARHLFERFYRVRSGTTGGKRHGHRTDDRARPHRGDGRDGLGGAGLGRRAADLAPAARDAAARRGRRDAVSGTSAMR